LAPRCKKNHIFHTYIKGETVEDCDRQALEKFQRVSENISNSWDGMDIVRIDIPATAEKVTFLKNNGRQNSNDEHSL
jgi:hypothetical protein